MRQFVSSLVARVALLGFALALWQGKAAAQDWKVERVGHYDGDGCWALHVEGSYVYVGEMAWRPWFSYPVLSILDVSSPASPVRIGMYDLPKPAEGVYVSGGLAYVAEGTEGLHIIDVSDPSSLRFVGSCDTIDNEVGAVDISVSGNLAFLPDWTEGLQIIDVANPGSPSICGSYDTPDIATRLCVSDDLVYMADSLSGIQIIDISNPATPTLRGSYDTPGSAEGVFVSANIAYVADWDSGVHVLDVTNPAAPRLLGSCATPPSAANLVVSDSLAYVACWESGLQVIDVTNPTQPSVCASYDTPGRAARVALSGGLVYLTDSAGGLWIFRVKMVDTIAPLITLLGDLIITLECGTPYADPGCTATDDKDGDITENVEITGSVDHTVPGSYTLKYNVKDSSGNPAEERSRTVEVVDTIAPAITLSGEDQMTLECGTPYSEPGFTATDMCDGDVAAHVVVTGSVDDTVLGGYTLHYNVSDSSGNPAEEKIRTVDVVDTTPPVITLLGDNPMTVECGSPYEEPGYTATDMCEGDLTADVEVTGSVDHTFPGSDALRYNVEDSSGNAAEETRVVEVVDTTPPVITLLGDNPLTLEVGTPYEEPGYTATDMCDGDLTEDVEVTGSVDHNVPGSYVLSYSVSDWSGNPAEETTRTVNVVEAVPFEIVQIMEAVPEGTVQLTWNSRPGATYTVWSCFDLGIGPWTEEATVTADGATTTWTDGDTGCPCKFYRIETQ